MKELTFYLQKSLRFPLGSLHRYLASDLDKLFYELKNQIHKTSLHNRVRPAWISDKTWAPINSRVTARWEGSQQTIRKLSQWIREGLSMYRKIEVEDSGSALESLLPSDPPPSLVIE